MKTTVKTEEGRAAVMPVQGSLRPAIFLTVDRGESGSAAVSLDKSGAYILGNALIHLAQTIEAREGGYELCSKVSSGVACTSRKGTKCPDCGPCLVDYAGSSAEARQ